MPITFNCPSCGRELEAPDSAAGSLGTCRFCGSTITAPSALGETAGLISAGVPPLSFWALPVDQPTGRLDLGLIITEAWSLLKAHWWALCAAQIISGLMMMAAMLPALIPFFLYGMRDIRPGANPFRVPPAMLRLEGLMMLVSILAQPLAAGPLYVTDRIVQRGEVDIALVFSPFKHYVALLRLGLVYYVPLITLGLIVYAFTLLPLPAMIAGFVITVPVSAVLLWLQLTVWQPAMMEVVDRGADGFAAAKASWEFTKGHRWMILGVSLIMAILASLGEYACYVGLFFTIGFAPLGHVLIYRHLRGLQGVQD